MTEGCSDEHGIEEAGAVVDFAAYRARQRARRPLGLDVRVRSGARHVADRPGRDTRHLQYRAQVDVARALAGFVGGHALVLSFGCAGQQRGQAKAPKCSPPLRPTSRRSMPKSGRARGWRRPRIEESYSSLARRQARIDCARRELQGLAGGHGARRVGVVFGCGRVQRLESARQACCGRRRRSAQRRRAPSVEEPRYRHAP